MTWRPKSRHEKELDLLRNVVHLEQEEVREEREEVRLEREEVNLLREIRDSLKRRLSAIKIRFGGIKMLGPVTLSVGQRTVATVVGFDQNGAPFPINFSLPENAVTWAVDNAAVASSSPAPDQSTSVAAVGAGVANLTATLGTLTDTETVTVVPAAPVLASIKVDFTTPA